MTHVASSGADKCSARMTILSGTFRRVSALPESFMLSSNCLLFSGYKSMRTPAHKRPLIAQVLILEVFRAVNIFPALDLTKVAYLSGG